jgi:hypothetical protein
VLLIWCSPLPPPPALRLAGVLVHSDWRDHRNRLLGGAYPDLAVIVLFFALACT